MDKRTWIAGLIAAAVISCAEPARELASDMLQDAGEGMRARGRNMHDAGERSSSSGADAGMLADAGRVLEDAGEVLVDAGRALDAGETGADARAQAPAAPTVLESDCNVQSGRKSTINASGDSTTSITFLAEFSIAGMTPEDVAGAAFVMCDWESFGEGSTACPANVTCQDIGTYPQPRADCQIQGIVVVHGTKASTGCGSRYESTAGGTTTTTGGRWRSVKLVIPAH